MSLPALHSAAEVATALGETDRFVKDKCRRGAWPHTRGARGRIGFTAEQFARVLELMSVDVADKPEPRMAFAPRSRRAS